MQTGVGVIALSYGKRRLEPNPVNARLGRELIDIIDIFDTYNNGVVVASQWEITNQLVIDGYEKFVDVNVTPADATKRRKDGTKYLDSEDVLRKAFELFESRGVYEVIVVANPFLRLKAVRKLVKKAGFDINPYPMMGRIGFDNSPLQLQWWCKGPIRFIIYDIIVKFGEIIGSDWHGIGEKK